MDEFRQSDELVAERDAYEAEQEMKNSMLEDSTASATSTSFLKKLMSEM